MTEEEKQAAFQKIQDEVEERFAVLKEKYKNNKHGRIPDDEVNKVMRWASEEIKKIP